MNVVRCPTTPGSQERFREGPVQERAHRGPIGRSEDARGPGSPRRGARSRGTAAEPPRPRPSSFFVSACFSRNSMSYLPGRSSPAAAVEVGWRVRLEPANDPIAPRFRRFQQSRATRANRQHLNPDLAQPLGFPRVPLQSEQSLFLNGIPPDLGGTLADSRIRGWYPSLLNCRSPSGLSPMRASTPGHPAQLGSRTGRTSA